MKRNTKKTRWNLLIILALAVALSYGGFKYLYPTQKAEIFAIDPAITLEYGDTNVSGELRKSTPVGQKGDYLLVLLDTRVIVLDVDGLDHLLGKQVSVAGYLSPTVDKSLPMYMQVKSLTVLE